ncbi:DNA-binding protein, partial [Dysosmobacter welbionis]
GVDDGLAGVQPIVAGEHVADAADQGKIQQPTIPEQLHGQEDGGQRAVGGPAEHSGQPQRRGEASRNPQQRSRHTAEGGPHEEGGHHLTALEPCGERHRGEQNLQQKRLRPGSALLHGGGNEIHARAVVIPGPAEVCQGND